MKNWWQNFKQREFWFVRRQTLPDHPDLYALWHCEHRWFFKVSEERVTCNLAWMTARRYADRRNAEAKLK